MRTYVIDGKARFNAELYCLENTVSVSPKRIKLSQLENSVLEYLCTHGNDVVTRENILKDIWPHDTGSDGHLNRVILLLRRKFESLGMSDVIDTIPRVGYIIKKVVTEVTEVTEDERNGSEKKHTLNKKKTIFYFFMSTVIALTIATYAIKKNEKVKFESYSFENATIVFDDNEFSIKHIPADLFKNSRKDGRYYIGIFEKALSVTYINDEMTTAVRKIFFRKSSSLKEDLDNQLECAIHEVNGSMPTLTHQTTEEHNSIKKEFEYEVSDGCPSIPKYKSIWNVSIMYSNNPDRPYFLSVSRLFNENRTLLFQTVIDGTIDTIGRNTRSQLRTGTSSVIASNVSDSFTPGFLLLSEYNQSGYTTELIKISKGIYYMSFMGGVILFIQ